MKTVYSTSMSIFKYIPDDALTEEVKRILREGRKEDINEKENTITGNAQKVGGGRTYKRKRNRRHRRKTYKKKAGYKQKIRYLDGVDVIYWINLDRSTDRRQRMQQLFNDPVFKGKKIVRIPAIDGNSPNIDQILQSSLQGMQSDKCTKIEYAYTLSHLNAIKDFSQSNDDVALIMEDDMTLEFKPYWKQSVKQIMENAPNDWNIIQLCYNSNIGVPQNLYNTYLNGNFACAGAYVLNKKKSLNQLNIFPQNISHEADHYLFSLFNTYAYKYPMFIYGTNEQSTIHQNHVPGHDASKMMILQYVYNQ